MKRLAVTGDDFGFSTGVNRAIVEAHERGILTHASLMVTGDAAREAVALARSRPSLGIGLHLTLVCGKPALAPRKVPHLVETDGSFPDSPVRAGLRYAFSPAARRDLRREIRAQLERFQETGLPLSHVDGHLHLHMHPYVLRILGALAQEFQIPSIRMPREELQLTRTFDRRSVAARAAWSWIFARLRRHGEGILQRAGVEYADRVYGLLMTGRVTEDYLLHLLPRISAPSSEIYCHPAHELAGAPRNGPPGAGPAELAALVSPRVRTAVAAEGFLLAPDLAQCETTGAPPTP
ncbi:MAG: hopanoid biosynthesis-associated protein HpnK [Thermoanaerobaculia bacterium]